MLFSLLHVDCYFKRLPGLHPENVSGGGGGGGAYTNFSRFSGGGYVTAANSNLAGGGGGGGRTVSPVQLRGVRRCREVVGLTVQDMVLPPLGGSGGMFPRKFFDKWML